MAGFKESWDEGEGVCLGEGQGGGAGGGVQCYRWFKVGKKLHG